MRIHRSAAAFIFTLFILMVAATWAQEVPESPETPEAAEAADAPEAAEVPEAAEDAEAPEEQEASETPKAAPSLVFETTVDFAFVKQITLDGRAGQVEVRGIEFTSASGKGGLFSSSDPDLMSGIVTKLQCSTAAETKQKLDLDIQFLDSEGALIDRVTNGISFKSGTKTFETNHKTLKYVVPLIAQVKITVAASAKN